MSLGDKKYFVRTYDNGVHTVMAPDIMSALNIYLGNTGRSVYTVYEVVDAAETDR